LVGVVEFPAATEGAGVEFVVGVGTDGGGGLGAVDSGLGGRLPPPVLEGGTALIGFGGSVAGGGWEPEGMLGTDLLLGCACCVGTMGA
jgi:hypothetical protein